MGSFTDFVWLFLLFSFFGWLLETVYAAIRRKRFVNRGFLNGPVCLIYGVATVLMAFFLRDLRDNWLFLFLGCAGIAFQVELIGGMILEKFGTGKWWDYSGRRGNLGGYVCIGSTAVWGVLGTVCMKWLIPLLLRVLHLVPPLLRNIVLIILWVTLVVDFLGSLMAVHLIRGTPSIAAANDRIDRIRDRLQRAIARKVSRRLEQAHPHAFTGKKREKSTVFAQGCGFYKLSLILLIGAFLGDIVETVFVRLTAGVWMSRSSLVWGQFSLVWGLAMALASLVLHRYQEKSDSFLFFFGFLFGGVFEYCCSVFTEIAFGTVFWDYSHIPFNLGGRINLLYCFFWGIAAVAWIRLVYPFASKWIEKLPMRLGKTMTWVLVVLLALDIGVTSLAMARYQERSLGQPAQTALGAVIDRAFPDEWMEQRYQNMQFVESETP